jgi:hypothetical protein
VAVVVIGAEAAFLAIRSEGPDQRRLGHARRSLGAV